MHYLSTSTAGGTGNTIGVPLGDGIDLPVITGEAGSMAHSSHRLIGSEAQTRMRGDKEVKLRSSYTGAWLI